MVENPSLVLCSHSDPFSHRVLARVAIAALGPSIAMDLFDSHDDGGNEFAPLAEPMQDHCSEFNLEGALAIVSFLIVPDTLDDVM
ncbi:MAG: hypothetical protein OXF56_17020 [Rhodobacteraceae bacterium]|nr:hypothetical protein [Paracoccaceae bacterium]